MEIKAKLKEGIIRKKNLIKIMKEKYKELDEEITSVKSKVKKLKDENSLIDERINQIKEKEERKYLIYDKDFKIKKI